jgi:hypothetical protein
MSARVSGESVQEVSTPPEFLRAVEFRVGMQFTWDLAADTTNHVTDQWYGPGSPDGEDSLVAPWDGIGLAWLNPPFKMIKKFAAKCAVTAQTVAMLIPASVATNWYAELIHGKAMVMPVRPRLTFVGHADPYPKDMMIVLYNLGRAGFEPWLWKPINRNKGRAK